MIENIEKNGLAGSPEDQGVTKDLHENNESIEQLLLNEAKAVEENLHKLKDEIEPVWGKGEEVHFKELKNWAKIKALFATIGIAGAALMENSFASGYTNGLEGQLRVFTNWSDYNPMDQFEAVSISVYIAAFAAVSSGVFYSAVKDMIHAKDLKNKALRRGQTYKEIKKGKK